MKLDTKYLDNYLKRWFAKNIVPLVKMGTMLKELLIIIKFYHKYEEQQMHIIGQYLDAHKEEIDDLIPITQEEADEYINKHICMGDWDEAKD